MAAGVCTANAQAFGAIIASVMKCDALKMDWCSDPTCKTLASSFYEACKADTAFRQTAMDIKSTMEQLGCYPTADPTATKGA